VNLDIIIIQLAVQNQNKRLVDFQRHAQQVLIAMVNMELVVIADVIRILKGISFVMEWKLNERHKVARMTKRIMNNQAWLIAILMKSNQNLQELAVIVNINQNIHHRLVTNIKCQ